MANYHITMTDAGAALIAKCAEGKALTFTAIQMGDGDAPDAGFQAVTALTYVRKTLPITGIKRDGALVICSAQLDYTSITEEFQWKEVGLVAKDPDTQEEAVYCYGNAGVRGDWITKGIAATAKHINIATRISPDADITAVIDNTTLYARADLSNVDLEALKKALASAGGITSDRIGAPGGVAGLDSACKLDADIDCGIWDEDPVAQHNAAMRTHEIMRVDGNAAENTDTSATLEEHIANPDAHQNLIIDGGKL